MSASSAIYFTSVGYSADVQKIYGRHAVGAGFLRGWVEHGRPESLFCISNSEQEFTEFASLVAPSALPAQQPAWLPLEEPQLLRDRGVDVLYHHEPQLAELAWLRRSTSSGSRSHSICGVTHSVAGLVINKALGELLLAPLEPWDALICTSRAAKAVVEDLFAVYGQYLQKSFGARVRPRLELPVIPLGVHTKDFDPPDRDRRRRKVRKQLGLADDALALLWRGRLNFYSKAHPVPMYLAIEKAARRSGKPLVLLQQGWFEDAAEQREFAEAAARFPSVRIITIGRDDSKLEADIWYAADIFISLIDNIQENFGVALVEAMAAGLPPVASDWDGYRDILRDGADGFLIPTSLPPEGAGVDLARVFQVDKRNWGYGAGVTALATHVDVEACANALVTLIQDPQLRSRMGESGRKRAQSEFDWQHILRRYQEVWDELARRRRRAKNTRRANAPPSPLCADPFQRYAAHATRQWNRESLVRLAEQASRGGLERLLSIEIDLFGQETRLSVAEIRRLVRAIGSKGATVATLLKRFPRAEAALHRTIGQLLKLDVLQLEPESKHSRASQRTRRLHA